ncbi:MAG: PD-(D/E)XK nuclease family protein [Gemmatimonadota bacterium]
MSEATPTAADPRGETPAPSRLLAALEEANARWPTERKLLVCRDRGEGRELLRALALRTGGWLGWEPTTLRDLAAELAFVTLADRGLRVLDEIELGAVTDAALDRIVHLQGERSRLRGVADAPGFRRAVAGAIEALRLTGWTARELRGFARRNAKLAEIALVLGEYEAELERRSGVDAAGQLGVAMEVFDAELPFLDARLVLSPGLGTRGRAGELLARLREAGASLLDAEPVIGLAPPPGVLVPAATGPSSAGAMPPAGSSPQLDLVLADRSGEPARASLPPPTRLSWLHAPERAHEAVEPLRIEFFQAASPTAEIREVLRRAVREGLRWDDVEIVTTDPDVYGCALDTLAGKLGIPVTYGVGLPLERSRVGRVLRGYLTWIAHGLHAKFLWDGLANGDLRPPEVDGRGPSRAGAARALRRLGIGWSRQRYATVLEAIPGMLSDDSAWMRMRRDDEDLDEAELRRRLEQRRLELASVQRFLQAVLEAIPPGVGEGGAAQAEPTVSAAALAAGALRFLRLFQPRAGAAEAESLERLRDRLTRIAEVATREVPLPVSIAELQSALSTLRALPPGTLGRQPWTSAAGAVHLTDLAHGGRAHRPVTFLVGLDAERTSLVGRVDPVLLERDRQALNGRATPLRELPLVAERVAENRYRLALLLASLRGTVTLSCAAWEAATGSELSPSPLLLQALRARNADPRLGFAALEEELKVPVSPVPAGSGELDATDVWLGALAQEDLLLAGEGLIRSAFAGLDSGLAAAEARLSGAPGVHYGFVPAAARLDPRTRRSAVSPSALQTLARCPLAWLHTYGLGLRKPQDAEYVAGRWLDDRERGSLLHAVFERFVSDWMHRQHELAKPAAEADLDRIVEEELVRARQAIPPSSDFAFEVESDEIRRSARLFLRAERGEDGGTWIAAERAFGSEGEAVEVTLPSGATLRLKGRIDRVDRLAHGGLRVIDYKGGRGSFYERAVGEPPFKGGRQIQPGIYVLAAEALGLGDVARFEYRFPSERGEGRVVAYTRGELDDALGVAEQLLDLVRAGALLPSDDPGDCKFCDHQAICRVTKGAYGRMSSPPAAWSERNRDLPIFGALRRLRSGAR